MSNYRPISLLTFFQKFMKKLFIKDYIFTLKITYILAKEEYVLRNNSSTEIASYNLINNLLKTLTIKCGLEGSSVI